MKEIIQGGDVHVHHLHEYTCVTYMYMYMYICALCKFKVDMTASMCICN